MTEKKDEAAVSIDEYVQEAHARIGEGEMQLVLFRKRIQELEAQLKGGKNAADSQG